MTCESTQRENPSEAYCAGTKKNPLVLACEQPLTCADEFHDFVHVVKNLQSSLGVSIMKVQKLKVVPAFERD